MPAIPLHTAVSYVAGAYLVFFALILIYVAIMASKLSRIETELSELTELAIAEREPGTPAQAARARRIAATSRSASGARATAGRARGGRAMSELLALGISHKTAPVALRERVAFDGPEAERFLRAATADPAVNEAVAISTCNRTEFYLVVGDAVHAESTVLALLAQRAGIRPTELAEVIYSPRNCDAARQLYRVTSGLESMIVGEHEVQGQVKRSYEAALSKPGRPAR